MNEPDMTQPDHLSVSDDWWPSSLVEFGSEQPFADEFVTVAEISQPWRPRSDKLLYTVLVPIDRMPELFIRRGCDIGHEVDSSGPWPSASKGEFHYTPNFGVRDFIGDVNFEPLVVTWESAGKTILLPDQGFLRFFSF